MYSHRLYQVVADCGPKKRFLYSNIINSMMPEVMPAKCANGTDGHGMSENNDISIVLSITIFKIDRTRVIRHANR